MHTPFFMETPSEPVFVSLHTLSLVLDLTERRVQQLAEAGVVVRKRQGHYDLIASIQGYIRYLRAQVRKKADFFSVEDLEQALAGVEAPPDEDEE